jgi:hypothetical protein
MEAYVRDLTSQPHRGYAFVQYQHRDSVAYACYALTGLILCGQPLRVRGVVDPTDPLLNRGDGVCPLEKYGPLSFDAVMAMDGVSDAWDEAGLYDLLVPVLAKYGLASVVAEDGGGGDALSLYPNTPVHIELQQPRRGGGGVPPGSRSAGFGLVHIRGIQVLFTLTPQTSPSPSPSPSYPHPHPQPHPESQPQPQPQPTPPHQPIYFLVGPLYLFSDLCVISII